MSWYGDSENEVVGGLERQSSTWRFKVRLGESVRVQFLDGDEVELPHPEKPGKTIKVKPPFRFKEHQYRTAQRYENFLTCTAPALGISGCAGCSEGETPRNRAAWSVIVTGHKKKDGTLLPPQVQLLVTDVDSTAYQSIMRQQTKLRAKGETLRGAVFEVSRLGKQAQSACAQGTQYDFEGIEEIPPEAEILNYFEEFAPPKSKADAAALLQMRVVDDSRQGNASARGGGSRVSSSRGSSRSSRDEEDDETVDYD